MHHKLEAYYSGTYFGETTINCPDKEGGYICKQPGTAILNIGANWPAGSYTIKLFNEIKKSIYFNRANYLYGDFFNTGFYLD